MMVWAYERTGSLLLMIVMHLSLTACSITFSPAAMTGWEVFIYSMTVAAVFWVIAFAFILADRKTFGQGFRFRVQKFSVPDSSF